MSEHEWNALNEMIGFFGITMEGLTKVEVGEEYPVQIRFSRTGFKAGWYGVDDELNGWERRQLRRLRAQYIKRKNE